MGSRQDTHEGHPEGCLLLSDSTVRAVHSSHTSERGAPPAVGTSRHSPTPGIRLRPSSRQPRRKSPHPILSAAETWEAPACRLTHQPRRPALDSGSAGRRARSASAHARPEGLLWGRASGTLACGQWRSLPPMQGPCRPGLHGREAAWSSLGRTSIAHLHPCGKEAPVGPPVPGAARAEPSSEQISSHPGPSSDFQPPGTKLPLARLPSGPGSAGTSSSQVLHPAAPPGLPVLSLCSFFTTCGLTSSPEPTSRPPLTEEALCCCC